MLITQQTKLTEEIKSLVEIYGTQRNALIPILQEVQKNYHHIPDFAMQAIADMFGIFPSEVYSVVTFYSFLNVNNHGKFTIRLCRTISCDMAGKNAVARQLENDLGIRFGETTPDGRFTLEWTNCIGQCDEGPAMLVNEMVFTQVTPEKIHEILQACTKVLGPHATHEEKEHLL